MSAEALTTVALQHNLLHEDPALRLQNLRTMTAPDFRDMLGQMNTAVTGNNPPESEGNAYIAYHDEEETSYQLYGTPNICRRPVLFNALKGTIDEIADYHQSEADAQKALSNIGRFIGRGIVGIHAYIDGSGRLSRGFKQVMQNPEPYLIADAVLAGNRHEDLMVYNEYQMDPYMDHYASKHDVAELERHTATRINEQTGIGYRIEGTVLRSPKAISEQLTGVTDPGFREHLTSILQNYRTGDIAIAQTIGASFRGIESIDDDTAKAIAFADADAKDAYALSVITLNYEASIDDWAQPDDLKRLYLG